MVMADFFARDRLQELWQQINHLHLSYLHTEDSPQKIEQRNKLEACIRDYLCLSPHKNKFFCPETADILHRSASTKKDFSGYKAAVGFNAISIYAGNLLSQPWRKEYHQIKTYSGFYKHQIEANLAGAESIFEAMGYKYMENGILIMDEPPCPDRLTHVSQDSIVAFVECQILKTIWEEVSNLYKISWLEVLEFRETHICSSEQSIRMLNYHYQEKKYQETQQQQQTLNRHTFNQGTEPNYSSINPNRFNLINNHPIQSHVINHPPPISTMHSFPPLNHDHNHTHYATQYPNRINDTINHRINNYPEIRHVRTGSSDLTQKGFPPLRESYPGTIDHRTINNDPRYVDPRMELLNNPGGDYGHSHRGVDYAHPHPHAHRGVDLNHIYGPITSHVQPCPTGCIYPYPYNFSYPVAYPRYNYPVVCHPSKHCNGYCYPNNGLQQNYIVPTGQLIELENQNGGYDVPDGLKNLRPSNDYLDHKNLAKSTNLDSLTLSKSREDGTGTFESWDYVYRNLESQGYYKDLGDRGDLLQDKRKSLRENKTKSSIELEDAFNSLNLSNSGNSTNESNLKVSEGVKRFSEINNKHESKVPLSNSYDNITQENSKRVINSNGVLKSNKVVSPEKPLDSKKLRKSDVDKLKSSLKVDKGGGVGGASLGKSNKEGWSCSFCTYLNKVNADICDMCNKSKSVVDNSIQIGGQECPKCTLVNPKNINFCQACNGSLKNSPTYI